MIKAHDQITQPEACDTSWGYSSRSNGLVKRFKMPLYSYVLSGDFILNILDLFSMTRVFLQAKTLGCAFTSEHQH